MKSLVVIQWRKSLDGERSGIRGYKSTTDRRWDVILTLCSPARPCQSSSSLYYYYISASSSLSSSTNQLKWEFKLEIDWRLACVPFSTLIVCVCVLWCNHVCVDFLLAAGLTSCPMETHWLGFLFNGQSSQSSQRPVGSGLTVWPVAFCCFCLSGMKTSHLIHTLCWSFSYDKQSTATHESSTTQTRLRCRKHVGFIYYNCKQRMVK